MSAKKVDVTELSRTFATLSDTTRLSILGALAAGPKNVTALCKALGLKQPAVSHHLGLLRMADLVVSERAGKYITYTLNTEALDDAGAFLESLFKA
jgi:DNA-binding transcriptional ArsR family regulator